MNKNRRLQIMPEVLPAPTKVTPSAGVRGRTVAHMQRLLAAASALPLADAACTKSDTQTTTVTIPPQSSVSAQSTVEGSLLPPPKVTASATATTPPQDYGYAVVDPMPAPARCMGLAGASKTTASFKQVAGGVALELVVTLPSGAAWAGSAFDTTQRPSPWSGTLVSSQITSHAATVRIKAPQGATSVGLSLAISCAAGSGSIAVTASFADPPTTSTKVTLSTQDY